MASKEPPWLAYARQQLGVREIVGPKHSPIIMGWIKSLGGAVLGIEVKDDETPWCGTFVAMCMAVAKHKPPRIAVRASSWGGWGRQLLGPRLGCVMVFTRTGGGHVGFYIGEDDGDPAGRTAAERAPSYHILGGNQNNAVTTMRLAKTRLSEGGMRWPDGVPLPPAQPIKLTPKGAPASENEA